MRYSALTLCLGLWLTSFCFLARAEHLRLDTRVSARGDYWSGDRELTDVRGQGLASLWGKARVRSEHLGQLIGDARVASGNSGGNTRLREFYWRYDSDNWRLSIGKQMLAWGRADGLNPTDNLSPKDFTLLTPKDADLREGSQVVNWEYMHGNSSLYLLWFPHAASHKIPLEAITGVTYKREAAPRQSQYALKWETLGSHGDGSISWFDGYDLMPDLIPGALTPKGLTILTRNQRLQVLGGDLSYAQGPRVWRAELAYSRTDTGGEGDFRHKKDQLWFVGGPEFTLDNNWVLGLQLSYKRVFDFASPGNYFSPGPLREVAWRQLATANQTRTSQVGITWRLAKSALNDTLKLETSGVQTRADGGLARITLDYLPRDAIHLRLGYEDYHGPSHSFFGQLAKNRLAYTEISIDF